MMKLNFDSLMHYRAFVNYSYVEVSEDLRRSDESLQKILKKNFFAHIYHCRPDAEEKLMAWIKLDNTELGIIVGAQGSGKSTIIRKIIDEVDNDKYCVVVLDMEKVYCDVEDDVEGGNLKVWKDFVEGIIEDYILENYYNANFSDFLTYLLFSGKTNLRKGLLKFIDGIEDLYAKYKLEARKKGSVLSVSDWFVDFRHEDRIQDIKKEITNKLRLSHYIESVFELKKGIFSHFIIVLDNVDRVPIKYQPYMYKMANDILNKNSALVNVIISTRRETAHFPEDIPGERSVPFIQLGVYGDHKQNYKWTQDEFNDILANRNAFFLEASTKGLIALDPQVAYQYIKISEYLVDVYASTVLVNIANQSIRDALKYHTEFIEYLYSEYDNSYSKLLSILEKEEVRPIFLLSALYGFLTKYSDVLDEQCIDLVKLVYVCNKNNYKGIAGCDLSYLLLVSIYNYKSKFRHKSPTVKNVFDKFNLFSVNAGVDKQLIKSHIFELYKLRSKDFGYILNIIGQSKAPISPSEIDDDAELELTFRGELLIKTVSVSFTFINRLLYNMNSDFYYKKSDAESFGSYYNLENIPRHAFNQARFLSEVAFMHALELHRIRSTINREDWYDKYISLFSVDGKLQLQRIIESNVKFLYSFNAISSFSYIIRNPVKKIIDWLGILNELYISEVKGFRLDNADNTLILDYRSLFLDYNNDKIEVMSLSEYKDAGYCIDISSKL